MSADANLWAVAFEGPGAARRVREELRVLEDVHCLMVEDVAIVTCLPDGTFKLEREPAPVFAVTGGCALIGLLVGMLAAQTLAGAAVGALVGGQISALLARVGIGDEFVREVKALMAPGTAVLFLMDEWGDREAVVFHLRGLGGKVLKTNVDPGWAAEVQAALAATPPTPRE